MNHAGFDDTPYRKVQGFRMGRGITRDPPGLIVLEGLDETCTKYVINKGEIFTEISEDVFPSEVLSTQEVPKDDQTV